MMSFLHAGCPSSSSSSPSWAAHGSTASTSRCTSVDAADAHEATLLGRLAHALSHAATCGAAELAPAAAAARDLHQQQQQHPQEHQHPQQRRDSSALAQLVQQRRRHYLLAGATRANSFSRLPVPLAMRSA